VDRETFAARFRDAAAASRSFASQYLEEELPPALRFRLRLNSSYDGNPLHADEVVFPGDATPERARQVLSCDADDVVAMLFRSDRVPEWVNLNVVGVTPTATLIEILACGRFTANEGLLYHRQEGRPPFHVLGPTLPLNWVQGQRFSIYYRSTCASSDELEAMRPYSAKTWSLDLESPMATDETLLALPDLPNLEILELKDSRLRGPGLSALARFPKLRIVRVSGVGADFDVASGPRLRQLEEVTIDGLPPRPCGVEAWAARLPSLQMLSLSAASDLHLAGAFPKRLGHLTLTGAQIKGEARLPRQSEWLSLHLSKQPSDALEGLLAPVREVESLSLSETPVGDTFVSKLLSRWKNIRYLEVVGTTVSEAFLRDLALTQPALKTHPVPKLPDITSEQVARKVEQELTQPMRFTNFHGIEPRTLRAALVKPYPVTVTPGDDESPPRRMWAVLREADGHLVVFDPESGLWVVAQREGTEWVETIAANTLNGALTPFG
jgi:hypothetical protein